VDVLFIVDISTNVDQASYNDMTNFFLNSFGTFNIATGGNGTVGTRFAIIRNPGNDPADWPGPVTQADFNSITSYNVLNMSFQNAWPDPVLDPPQDAGQAFLTTALQMAADPGRFLPGFRTNINNHLLIYMTTNSTPDANDTAQVQQIQAAGTYQGIMGIAYKNPASTLANFTGNPDCVITGNSLTELTTNWGTKLPNVIYDATNLFNGTYNCTVTSFTLG